MKYIAEYLCLYRIVAESDSSKEKFYIAASSIENALKIAEDFCSVYWEEDYYIKKIDVPKRGDLFIHEIYDVNYVLRKRESAWKEDN